MNSLLGFTAGAAHQTTTAAVHVAVVAAIAGVVGVDTADLATTDGDIGHTAALEGIEGEGTRRILGVGTHRSQGTAAVYLIVNGTAAHGDMGVAIHTTCRGAVVSYAALDEVGTLTGAVDLTTEDVTTCTLGIFLEL